MWGLVFGSCRPEPSRGCCRTEHVPAPVQTPRGYDPAPPKSLGADSEASTTARSGLTTTRSGTGENGSAASSLEVPACFGCGSSRSAAPVVSEEQALELAMQCFVRTLHNGVEVRLLLDDGTVIVAEASLNFQVTRLTLRVNQIERSIPLGDISQVCGPESAKDLGTTNGRFLDERCVTLVLPEDQFLSFDFDNAREREYFEACLRALIATRAKSTVSCREDDFRAPKDAILTPEASQRSGWDEQNPTSGHGRPGGM